MQQQGSGPSIPQDMPALLSSRLAGGEPSDESQLGSGNRLTFVKGEQVLWAWMAENTYVSWVVRERPWELEDELIAELDLPLNLQGNSHNRFHPVLTGARARCVARQGIASSTQSCIRSGRRAAMPTR